MEIKLFGFTLLKTGEENKNLKSFVPPSGTNDEDTLEVSSNFYSTFLNLENTARDMSIYPEVEVAIDDIVSEAIVNETDDYPIKLLTKNLEQTETVKSKIAEEFNNILNILDFKNQGYDIFRSWYIDGRLYFHIIIDENKPKEGIKELRKIDPRTIKKVKEIERDEKPGGPTLIKSVKEFYLYNEKGILNGADKTTGIPISPDAIAYVSSGLKDAKRNYTINYLAF